MNSDTAKLIESTNRDVQELIDRKEAALNNWLLASKAWEAADTSQTRKALDDAANWYSKLNNDLAVQITALFDTGWQLTLKD